MPEYANIGTVGKLADAELAFANFQNVSTMETDTTTPAGQPIVDREKVMKSTYYSI